MGSQRADYFNRVYTSRVYYLVERQDAPLSAGAPAFVDPPLVSGSDLDVAPYATMIPVADVMREARACKGRLFHGDERGRRLDAFIEFLDDGEVEGKHWVAAQLEPPAVAGRATASARTDPDVPPADDD